MGGDPSKVKPAARAKAMERTGMMVLMSSPVDVKRRMTSPRNTKRSPLAAAEARDTDRRSKISKVRTPFKKDKTHPNNPESIAKEDEAVAVEGVGRGVNP
jgi:hypothetical protein